MPNLDWVTKDLVVCADGPLRAQWFLLDDWHERLRAANYMAEKGGRPDRSLWYLPTDHTITHPDQPRAVGRVWTTS